LPIVPQKTRHYNTTDESVFLAQQAADAKAAMQRTVADMKTRAIEVANVRWWTQQYPWYAVGAAAVIGFVAAAKGLEPSDHRAPPAQTQMVARPSLMSSLFEMARSTLMSAIIGAIHNSQQAGQAQTSTDGQQAGRANV
jgi:hypothetical protein